MKILREYFDHIMIGWTILIVAIVSIATTFLAVKIIGGKMTEKALSEQSEDYTPTTTGSSIVVSPSAVTGPYNVFVRDEEMQNDTGLDDVELPGTTKPVVTVPPVKTTSTPKPQKTNKPKQTAKPTRRPQQQTEPQQTVAPTQAPVVTNAPTPAPTQEPVITPEPQKPDPTATPASENEDTNTDENNGGA